MNVADHGAISRRGRLVYRSIFVLSASAVLLCDNGAALAGPCTMQIVQFERRIADSMTDPMSGPILPQSLDAQLHHQPTLETVVQAQHARNIDGNAVIDLARKADSDGDVGECIRALVEARRLFDLDN